MTNIRNSNKYLKVAKFLLMFLLLMVFRGEVVAQTWAPWSLTCETPCHDSQTNSPAFVQSSVRWVFSVSGLPVPYTKDVAYTEYSTKKCPNNRPVENRLDVWEGTFTIYSDRTTYLTSNGQLIWRNYPNYYKHDGTKDIATAVDYTYRCEETDDGGGGGGGECPCGDCQYGCEGPDLFCHMEEILGQCWEVCTTYENYWEEENPYDGTIIIHTDSYTECETQCDPSQWVEICTP